MPNTAVEPRVHVAVGVICDGAGRILVTRRAAHLHQGDLWEFPGGKCERGETVAEALARELDEELGIRPTRCAPLLEILHDYTDKRVLLDVWWVLAFEGEPRAREGQPMRWVLPEQLTRLAFPAANQRIVEAVQAAQWVEVSASRSSENSSS
ncbi:MAG: 8-oxo-dGTP diphosphatase MutT [Spongiibacteraceae bacterium]|jgi:8-oxo-dGTP diphosphatase|nr:8-oxo-dGTP diphosphatase MutT [Spongiibacteraceae bacterium]